MKPEQIITTGTEKNTNKQKIESIVNKLNADGKGIIKSLDNGLEISWKGENPDGYDDDVFDFFVGRDPGTIEMRRFRGEEFREKLQIIFAPLHQNFYSVSLRKNFAYSEAVFKSTNIINAFKSILRQAKLTEEDFKFFLAYH